MTKPHHKVKPYLMPVAAIGSSVIFYPCKPSTCTPETEGQLALVVGVADQGLRLAIIPPDTLGFKCPDDAIRHRTDPLAESHFDGDSGDDQGFWDFNPHQLSDREVADARILLTIYKSELEAHRKVLDDVASAKGPAADATAA